MVSGLRRSGTSMMMNILYNGGLDIIIKKQASKADEFNPNGYFEYSIMDYDWIKGGFFDNKQGKVVKILASYIELFKHNAMPREYNYKLIWMERNIKEVIESWRRRKEKLPEKNAGIDPPDSDLFVYRKEKALQWINEQPNIEIIIVKYLDVLKNPKKETLKVQEFLDIELNIENAIRVVDSSLYKVRL